MKIYDFSKLPKDYKIQLFYYAKRLDADEMTIHKNGTITLMCKDGCICHNYSPTNKELYNH